MFHLLKRKQSFSVLLTQEVIKKKKGTDASNQPWWTALIRVTEIQPKIKIKISDILIVLRYLEH